MIALPGYYLVLCSNGHRRISIRNSAFVLIPGVLIGISYVLHSEPILVEAQSMFTAMSAANFRRSRMMRMAIGIDQIPIRILSTIDQGLTYLSGFGSRLHSWLHISKRSGLHYYSCSWVASPWWYLEAQMLPEYAHYFRFLLCSLQLLTAMLVYSNVALVDPSVGVSFI